MVRRLIAKACRKLDSFSKALNAMREIIVASHGNSYEGWARQCREFKKNLGVGGGAGGLFKAGAVADGLAQFRELAF